MDNCIKASIAIINALLQHDIKANTRFCGEDLADERYNAVETLSKILHDVIPPIDIIAINDPEANK